MGTGYTQRPAAKKETIGVDVFVQWRENDPNKLGAELSAATNGDGLKLYFISNRGQKVWPDGLPETFCVDHWRCRYFAEQQGAPIHHGQIVRLLDRVAAAGYDFIKTENLCTFDGEKAFTVTGGE